MDPRNRALGGIERQLALDICLFVQAIATPELKLDDLYGLASSRLDVSEDIAKSYPFLLAEKIQLLPKLTALVSIDLPPAASMNAWEDVDELRQRLVHGSVIELSADPSGYRFTIAKMGKREKTIKGQELLRDRKHFTRRDFFERVKEVCAYRAFVERLREEIWNSGDGWPEYLVPHEGDPLQLDRLSDVMHTNA